MNFRKHGILILLLLAAGLVLKAQDRFFITKQKASISIPFDLVNNLIVIPVEINGKELPFLLDTGIENTLLFNFKFRDSITLKDVEEVKLYGLGNGHSITALRSKNNLIRIDDILNIGHTLFVVMEDKFDMSEKMGIDINGIIGGDLFKDFVIDINYSTKRLTFHKPETFSETSLKKFKRFDLDFRQQKPYIDALVVISNGERVPVHLLIDSGSGDALWLFEGTHEKISVPEKNFDDYLGQGLSGGIFGKRTRIEKLFLGDFEFELPTVSFPDSESVQSGMLVNGRNGTLGSEVLRRMRVIFDYPNKQLFLRKTRKVKEPFLYNKSGVELVYAGKILMLKEENFITPFLRDSQKNGNMIFSEMVQAVKLAYRPSYKISYIRNDSPAEEAGLLPGDMIMAVNGKPAYEFSLQQMIAELSGKHRKKIRLRIKRGNAEYKVVVELKDIL